ncbi:hypothetical protein A2415_04725 [candidate division WWE3 bacterium RIFOXYC1_FULL_39_7]|uniref:Cell division protein FtsL n=2 Tax=Katanobacteria TaxID=422282 RepID=A0A1F4X6I0_UNCKA|nr:MAG: hypothetical protein A2415_04725 [candidate division WWE3 bacterium RIFOXYC1_FULL_39_7]OGC77305.1 MAG: hypothetical protein A2619_04685 [candidate division WWE3 bacterium RIFOXYD1_FULL_39_9]
MRIKRYKPRTKLNSKSLCAMTFAVFLLTLMVRMYISSKLTASTVEMSELIDKKITLEQEIAKLNYENSGLSSISVLEDRAVALGFSSIQDNLLSLEIDSSTTIAAISSR